MADFSAEVVRYLRRKSENGYDEPITYLGAEQRFVNALRNSGVNNLEEQYIIGTDTYTETYINEDGNKVVEKEFHVNSGTSATTGYYKLVTVYFADGTVNEDFYFENLELKLPNDANEVVWGDGSEALPDEETLYCVGDTTFIQDGSVLKVFPSSYTTMEKDDLYYVKDKSQPSTDVHVLTKTVGKKYINDGAREVIRENITNHIAAAI